MSFDQGIIKPEFIMVTGMSAVDLTISQLTCILYNNKE
jgi:hypothetical protein